MDMVCMNDTVPVSRYVFNHLQGAHSIWGLLMGRTVIIPEMKYKMEVTFP